MSNSDLLDGKMASDKRDKVSIVQYWFTDIGEHKHVLATVFLVFICPLFTFTPCACQ